MPRCSPSSQQSPALPSPPGAPAAAEVKGAPVCTLPASSSGSSDDAWLESAFANFRAFVVLLLDRVPAARELVPATALDLPLGAFLAALRLDPDFALVVAASRRGDRPARDAAARLMVARSTPPGVELDDDDAERMSRYIALWSSVV